MVDLLVWPLFWTYFKDINQDKKKQQQTIMDDLKTRNKQEYEENPNIMGGEQGTTATGNFVFISLTLI